MLQSAIATSESYLHPGARTDLRMLVLEDSEFDAHRLKRAVKQIDPRITVAGFSRLIKESTYDFVAIDYLLPDGDGIEALREVKNSLRKERPALIMISGEGNARIEADARAHGCAAYITKAGMNTETLRDTMDRALAASPSPSVSEMSLDQARSTQSPVAARARDTIDPAKAASLQMLRSIRFMKRLTQIAEEPALKQAVSELEANCLKTVGYLYQFRSRPEE